MQMQMQVEMQREVLEGTGAGWWIGMEWYELG
jgi:hypothetical protein